MTFDTPLQQAGLSIALLSLLFAAYAFAGYPVLLRLLGVLRRNTAAAPGYEPAISFLITAHNEQVFIAEKLANTLALDYPADRIEVLVASDGSSDATNEIVRSFHPRVKLVAIGEQMGKTSAQNTGVRHCSNEIVVFSDAASLYDGQALRWLAAEFRDPRVGGVSGRYRYVDGAGKSPTAAGVSAFWEYENEIKRLQSRLSTLTGCSGCIYAVRRALYQELPSEACSDLLEPLTLVSRGYRVAFAERALAYEHTTQSVGEEFRMRVRVLTRGINSLLMAPELLKPWRRPWIAFQLFSHKIARWLIPLYAAGFLTGTLLLATELNWAAALVAMQVLFYAAGVHAMFAQRGKRSKPVALAMYVCVLGAAVVVSAIDIAKGANHTIWQPVRKPS